MTLSRADIDEVHAIVRAEIKASGQPRKRRRLPCGRGRSPPQCMGSAALGPHGCTCREAA